MNKKSNKGSDEKVNHKLDRGTHRVLLNYKTMLGPAYIKRNETQYLSSRIFNSLFWIGKLQKSFN